MMGSCKMKNYKVRNWRRHLATPISAARAGPYGFQFDGAVLLWAPPSSNRPLGSAGWGWPIVAFSGILQPDCSTQPLFKLTLYKSLYTLYTNYYIQVILYCNILYINTYYLQFNKLNTKVINTQKSSLLIILPHFTTTLEVVPGWRRYHRMVWAAPFCPTHWVTWHDMTWQGTWSCLWLEYPHHGNQPMLPIRVWLNIFLIVYTCENVRENVNHAETRRGFCLQAVTVCMAQKSEEIFFPFQELLFDSAKKSIISLINEWASNMFPLSLSYSLKKKRTSTHWQKVKYMPTHLHQEAEVHSKSLIDHCHPLWIEKGAFVHCRKS